MQRLAGSQAGRVARKPGKQRARLEGESERLAWTLNHTLEWCQACCHATCASSATCLHRGALQDPLSATHRALPASLTMLAAAEECMVKARCREGPQHEGGVNARPHMHGVMC